MSNHQLHSQLLFISPLVLSPAPRCMHPHQAVRSFFTLSLPLFSLYHSCPHKRALRVFPPPSTSVLAFHSLPYKSAQKYPMMNFKFHASLQIPGDTTSNNPEIDFNLFADGVNLKTSVSVWRSVRGLILAPSSLSLLLFSSPTKFSWTLKTTCSLKVYLKRLLSQIVAWEPNEQHITVGFA